MYFGPTLMSYGGVVLTGSGKSSHILVVDVKYVNKCSSRVAMFPSLLVLGRAVLARGPVPDEVDLAEAAAAQLLNHPVLGPQLGQRPVRELHDCRRW